MIFLHYKAEIKTTNMGRNDKGFEQSKVWYDSRHILSLSDDSKMLIYGGTYANVNNNNSEWPNGYPIFKRLFISTDLTIPKPNNIFLNVRPSPKEGKVGQISYYQNVKSDNTVTAGIYFCIAEFDETKGFEVNQPNFKPNLDAIPKSPARWVKLWETTNYNQQFNSSQEINFINDPNFSIQDQNTEPVLRQYYW